MNVDSSQCASYVKAVLDEIAGQWTLLSRTARPEGTCEMQTQKHWETYIEDIADKKGGRDQFKVFPIEFLQSVREAQILIKCAHRLWTAVIAGALGRATASASRASGAAR